MNITISTIDKISFDLRLEAHECLTRNVMHFRNKITDFSQLYLPQGVSSLWDSFRARR